MTRPEPDSVSSSAWARATGVVRSLGAAGPLLLWCALGPLLGVVVLTATSGTWLQWFAEAPGGVAAGAFWLVGGVLAALCLVPTHATSLCAGYLFGKLLGGALGWLVVLLAATLGYALFARLLRRRVLDAIAREPRIDRVHAALLRSGTWRTIWLIALLRLSPVMPFAATNLTMAAVGVRPGAFLFATMLGVSPRSIAVALVGGELSELDWSAGAGSLWTVVLAVVATVAFLVLVGRLARRALAQELGGPGAAADAADASEERP